MSVQNVYGDKTADGRLGVEWETLGKPVATSVQIALNSEFTEETRTFVLDRAAQMCALDVGPGRWFYRVGTWFGTETEGVIEWSGIYGPVDIQSKKPRVPLAEFPTFLTSVKPALNSIVFHTGLFQPYYMVFNYTEKDHFKSSGLKSVYRHDWGEGSIRVTNLDPAATYSFQLQMFGGGMAALPTGNTIQLLTEAYIVKNKRAGMPVKATNGTESAVYAADKAILHGRRKQNFSSYAEYLQYTAAAARTSAGQ